MITISEIEEAILQRLIDKGLEAGEIKVQKGVEGLVKPAVFVSTDDGRFERITDKTYKQTVSLNVFIVVKHLKSEAERRQAAYPLIGGVVGILLAQTLGLKITPLKPQSFRNITTEDLIERGLMAYQVVFETSFNIDKMTEEEASELLRISLGYYLKPGDAVADAQDDLTLE